MWIDEKKEEAHFKGLTVVDAPTVITTHITEIIKDNMPDLLNYAETQKLLDELPKEYQKLVADVVPAQIARRRAACFTKLIVRACLHPRLTQHSEGLAEATSFTKNIAQLTEHVRSRLARQLCDVCTPTSMALYHLPPCHRSGSKPLMKR